MNFYCRQDHEEEDFGEDYDDVEDVPETLQSRITTLGDKIAKLQNFANTCDVGPINVKCPEMWTPQQNVFIIFCCLDVMVI